MKVQSTMSPPDAELLSATLYQNGRARTSAPDVEVFPRIAGELLFFPPSGGASFFFRLNHVQAWEEEVRGNTRYRSHQSRESSTKKEDTGSVKMLR